MAKLLKIRTILNKCKECDKCLVFSNREETEFDYICNYNWPERKDITSEEVETFPTWCPLNDYPYNA